MKKNVGGRPTLFGSKQGGDRIQGRLSRAGSLAFERARQRLARLTKLDVEKIGDADTVEYLARGEQETVRLLGLHVRPRR